MLVKSFEHSVLIFIAFYLLKLSAAFGLERNALYGPTTTVENFWELLTTVTAVTRIHCVIHCQGAEACVAVHYKPLNTECVLLKPQTVFSIPFQIPIGHSITRNKTPVNANPMVFRTSGGKGANVYSPFVTDAYISPTTEGVTDISQKINYTYKHPSFKYWDQLKIKEVHFTLWTGSREVVKLTFDGRGSTKMNWFSHARLIQSSFTDLMTANPLMVSISGYRQKRRFYVVKEHRSCSLDIGWVCFKEKDWNCPWENHPPHPTFIYSKIGSAAVYVDANDTGYADEFILDLIVEI